MRDFFDLISSKEEDENRSRRINGVVIGIVTENNDPQGLGRIKIQFQWYSEKDETDWIRICTPMAGSERGMFFLPDKDDEVLVAFENGDVSRPIVIGALWNRQDKAPIINTDGKNDIKGIKTRSGHEIIFRDTDGEEQIEIHSMSGQKILFDDTTGSEKIIIHDKDGENSIEINSKDQSVIILGKNILKMEAENVQIEASKEMTLKASGSMVIKGQTVRIN